MKLIKFTKHGDRQIELVTVEFINRDGWLHIKVIIQFADGSLLEHEVRAEGNTYVYRVAKEGTLLH